MYQIKDVQISGIRNFKQEQISLFNGNGAGTSSGTSGNGNLKISFNSPVTLLGGNNGTGKTVTNL